MVWITNEQTRRRKINHHDQRSGLINLRFNSVGPIPEPFDRSRSRRTVPGALRETVFASAPPFSVDDETAVIRELNFPTNGRRLTELRHADKQNDNDDDRQHGHNCDDGYANLDSARHLSPWALQFLYPLRSILKSRWSVPRPLRHEIEKAYSFINTTNKECVAGHRDSMCGALARYDSYEMTLLRVVTLCVCDGTAWEGFDVDDLHAPLDN